MKKRKDQDQLILKDVLRGAKDLPWSFSLYLPFDTTWKCDTPCVVLDTADLGEDEMPEQAMARGFEYAMGMKSVQEIVANVFAQKPTSTEGDLLAALLHYYDTDAFIEMPRD